MKWKLLLPSRIRSHVSRIYLSLFARLSCLKSYISGSAALIPHVSFAVVDWGKGSEIGWLAQQREQTQSVGQAHGALWNYELENTGKKTANQAIGPLYDPVTCTKSHMLVSKLRSRTSKTMQLVPVHLDLPLFWQFAHQHVWFCTMWPDGAKGLFGWRFNNYWIRLS